MPRVIRTWEEPNARGERNYVGNGFFRWADVVPSGGGIPVPPHLQQAIYSGRWNETWSTLYIQQSIAVANVTDTLGQQLSFQIPAGSIVVPADIRPGPIFTVLANAVLSSGSGTLALSAPEPPAFFDNNGPQFYEFSQGDPFCIYAPFIGQPEDWDFTDVVDEFDPNYQPVIIGGAPPEVEFLTSYGPLNYRDLSISGTLEGEIDGAQDWINLGAMPLNLRGLPPGEIIQPGDLVYHIEQHPRYEMVAARSEVQGDGTVHLIMRAWGGSSRVNDGRPVRILRPSHPDRRSGHAIVITPRHGRFLSGTIADFRLNLNSEAPALLSTPGVWVDHDPTDPRMYLKVGYTLVTSGGVIGVQANRRFDFRSADDTLRSQPALEEETGIKRLATDVKPDQMIAPVARLYRLDVGGVRTLVATQYAQPPQIGYGEIVSDEIVLEYDTTTTGLYTVEIGGVVALSGITSEDGQTLNYTPSLYGTAPSMIVRWVMLAMGRAAVDAPPIEFSFANTLWQQGNRALKNLVLGDRFIKLRLRDIATEEGFVAADELLVLGASVRIVVPGLIDPPGSIVRIVSITHDLVDIGNTELVVDALPPKLLPIVDPRRVPRAR